MNLAIDVGNTLIKLAVYESSALQLKKVCLKNEFLKTLVGVSEKFPSIKNCIISSVSFLTEHQMEKLQGMFKVTVLSSETKVPFNNLYATPKTLGVDRIGLIAAASVRFPKKNILIVDAGSCITYDFLNSENEYLGGAISPGIEIRYKALNNYTAKLPLLNSALPKKMIGDSTATSIHVGIMDGVLHEIDGFLTQYKNKYPDLTVILTGGDLHFLQDRLKNDIFADSNFLLEGLHYILEHNSDSC